MSSLLEVEATDVVRSTQRHRPVLHRVQGLSTSTHPRFGVGEEQPREGAREDEAVACCAESGGHRGLRQQVQLLRGDRTSLPGARPCQRRRSQAPCGYQGVSAQRLSRGQEGGLPAGVPTALSQLQRRQAHPWSVSS